MSGKYSKNRRWLAPAVVPVVASALVGGVSMAGGGMQTDEPVAWYYDPGTPVGTSQLIRTPNGVSANFQTTGLPAGQAVTLWFMIFNHPEQCAAAKCEPLDLENPATEGDFHYGGGGVTGGSGNATFAGHLAVGDVSGSGFAEVIGAPGVPLADPFGAQVLLAIHSHGPKLKGTALVEQLSSYLGGCAVFLGPGGFAVDPAYIPVYEGECSTVQFSLHTPD